MEIKFIILTIFILAFGPVISQENNEIKIGLNTQAEVDSFPKKYPNIEEVASLYIRSNRENPILNLDSLSQIKRITDFLILTSNHQLESISGLRNLSYARSLEFFDNDRVPSLTAFESLSKVHSKIKIAGNKILVGFEIINKIDLDSITSLTISGNENMNELHIRRNLKNLKYLGIEGNRNLSFMSDFEVADTMEYISISANPKLKIINTFQSIKKLSRLMIVSNLQLEKIHFPRLKMIEAEFLLIGNINLKDATFLKKIKFGKNPDVTIVANYKIQIDHLSNVCFLKSKFPETVFVERNSIDCPSK